jgi:Na+/melibiose symporter-like transporter
MLFTLVMGQAMPPDQRAFLMSRRWSVLGAAKLVALAIVGPLIEGLPFPYGYQLIFGVNALLAGAAFYCATQIDVPERAPTQAKRREPIVRRIRQGVLEVWQEKPFLAFVGGRAFLRLGLALVSAVIPIYWVDDLQASDTWVGYFNAMLSGATLLSYFLWVRVKRRYGHRWTLIPSVLGIALYPALLALARGPTAVLPVIAFNGLAGAGINLAFFDALLQACPRNREAHFVAINMTAIHLMGVIGPPIGAALLEILPIRSVLVIATVVALSAAAIFTFVRPARRG